MGSNNMNQTLARIMMILLVAVVLTGGGRLIMIASALTPPDAGRWAESLARQQQSSSSGSPGADTLLAQAGTMITHDPNAPLAPPLDLATTYERRVDDYRPDEDYAYARSDNPTRRLLEREIGRLETKRVVVDKNSGGGHENAVMAAAAAFTDGVVVDEQQVTCCAFASGMMAASSVILAHQAPLHVLLPRDLYHGVQTVLLDVFSRFGVTVVQLDLNDLDAVDAAVSRVPPTAHVIVWLETPSNPLCHVLDIRAIAKRARTTAATVRSEGGTNHRNVTILVDSTLAPPAVVSQPLWHGADLVLHSATKYLGGHSDALLGVVTASPFTDRGAQLGPLLRQVQNDVGGVAAPFDCWLTLRGLRTLSLRVTRQSATALALARFLQAHPAVRAVHYPGLVVEDDPSSYDIAVRQMKLFGGVLSFEVADATAAWALAGALRVIRRATSLGGTETLIEHRASIEPVGRVTSPPGLLRLSVGLEDPDDLVADFTAALDIMKRVCTADAGRSREQ